METITRINDAVNSFAWGTFGLVLLLGTGLICTFITGVFQVAHLRHWWGKTFGAIKGEARIINDAGALSQFRAFCMALCSTIGTGNIAGVSTAICVGGPGAVFWMWIAAFLGMMTKYSENVLGLYYRRRNSEGAWSGGPMYYLEDGLGSIKKCKQIGKILAVAFCIFTVLASFGIGNLSQINKITLNMEAAFLADVDMGTFWGAPILDWWIGVVLMLVGAVIIMGGFRRLAYVSETLVPVMSIAYIAGCLIIILCNIEAIPAVFRSIFHFALGPDALKGGAVGTAVQVAMNTIKSGCKRGVFSNEAGLGSSVMAHVNTCAREPVKQGMWGMAEVFLDTIIICTITAIVVLSSGAIDLNTGLTVVGTDDATLVAHAFNQVLGRPGEIFVVIIITLFAFTTVMGWSYYGAKVVEYLIGVTWAKIYRFIFIILMVFGAVMESSLVWDISDTFNGLMMIPNLIGVLVLSPLVVKLTRNYADRRVRGKDVAPMLSYNRDIQSEAIRAINKGAY
ncbi:alanine or glycine:cation symporter, AGCS family [Butyrivibrio sp. ob235]|uniref:alanine/glycine:cation symporter family protein n=1 Tax=unclassified Butyrivibrio TaxID=2639466 RepID=UPI0003B6A596|nr:MULTISPECIES: alanine/glycine:cation symporter family protein [unclassified Butyrivibrio]SEL74817.1 alanine or glycine:cation symporter, AGCS family [Butyrivibrio sp. ob235]